MPTHHVVLIPGDGIGPEVTAAVQRILAAAKAPIVWEDRFAGLAALAQNKPVLPEETLEAIEHFKIAIKGPCTTPVGQGFASINVTLRKKFNLYAAVRPVRSLPGVKTRYENVDLVVVRENTEGLYSGVENEIAPGIVMSMKVASEAACRRIAHWAFRYATKRRRKKVTVFHKANIMKLTDGMFLRCAQEIHEDEYPNIEYQSLIIDAGCMKLVQDPGAFDVLLMENLYGDVVSDLCAGLVGGLGVVPGANIGDDRCDLRGRPRLRARHRRQGDRQPAGAADVGRDDAQPPRRHAPRRHLPQDQRCAQERLRPDDGGRQENARPGR